MPWFCGRRPCVRGTAVGGKLLNFSEPQLPSSQMGERGPMIRPWTCLRLGVTLPPSFPFNVETLRRQHYSITFSP